MAKPKSEWIIGRARRGRYTVRTRANRVFLGYIAPYEEDGRVLYTAIRPDGGGRDFRLRWFAANWLMSGKEEQ